jgi:hypothetical protein
VTINCFNAVHRWFTLNGLSLQLDKSGETVISTGARQRLEGEISTISRGSVAILVSRVVQTLGVTIDSTMSCDHHADNICRISFCHVRVLHCIGKLTSSADIKTADNALVSSRFDYCNSLLYGVSECNFNNFSGFNIPSIDLSQTQKFRMSHHTSSRDLNCQLVNVRINLKVALHAYKTLPMIIPACLHGLPTLHKPSRQLRSSNH